MCRCCWARTRSSSARTTPSCPASGRENGNEHFATLVFFDDPSVILNNTNGRYPQGFATPGIVRSWQQANGGAINGKGDIATNVQNASQFGTWYQDDWRVTTRLTLNLGVRYDIDFNLMDQKLAPLNATRIVLEKIGNPYGGIPKTPLKDISPRVGFAYDLSGDGRRVVRGGYGLYFDQYNVSASAGDITSQNHRPLNALAMLTNTAIGVGQLATYRFGIDPLPPQPTEGNSLPLNSAGQWQDPAITDPRTHQMHIGYAHTMAANTVLSVDYSHVEGRKELRQLNLSPIINGVRKLAPDFVRAGLPANTLSTVNVLSAINKSRYQALTFLFQRRYPRATLQAHYTLAKAPIRMAAQPAIGRARGSPRIRAISSTRVNGDRMGPTSVTGWWPRACSSCRSGSSFRPSCSWRARARTT